MQNRHIRGFKDIQLLRREVNNEFEFMTTLTFEAFDAVLDFLGGDVEQNRKQPR